MISFKTKIEFNTSHLILRSDLLLLARPRPIWAQLLERRSCGGPTTLGEAAGQHPGRVLHALHAQALRPCLAAARIPWPA
jgi:hypothetical protein